MDRILHRSRELAIGANHDPAVYQDPHLFNPERSDKHHYSFGGGAHYCIGAPLARAEAQIGLSALFERFPKIRLSETRFPVRKSIPAFNGLESLYVEVGLSPEYGSTSTVVRGRLS